MPLKLAVDIFDDKGKLIHHQESHSFVKQMLQLLGCIFGENANNQTILDITNTGKAFSNPSYSAWSFAPFRVYAAAGAIDSGIVAGLGTGANSPNDYVLGSPCAHGTGVNNLQYGVSAVNNAAVAGSNITMVLTRTVTNGTASTITINEVGIYSKNCYTGTTQATFCIARDKLSVGVDITAGASKTIQYTWTEAN